MKHITWLCAIVLIGCGGTAEWVWASVPDANINDTSMDTPTLLDSCAHTMGIDASWCQSSNPDYVFSCPGGVATSKQCPTQKTCQVVLVQGVKQAGCF